MRVFAVANNLKRHKPPIRMAYFNIDHRESRSGVIYHLGALLAVSAWGASFISTDALPQCGMSAVVIMCIGLFWHIYALFCSARGRSFLEFV